VGVLRLRAELNISYSLFLTSLMRHVPWVGKLAGASFSIERKNEK
jgi:hypothetical protein